MVGTAKCIENRRVTFGYFIVVVYNRTQETQRSCTISHVNGDNMCNFVAPICTLCVILRDQITINREAEN